MPGARTGALPPRAPSELSAPTAPPCLVACLQVLVQLKADETLLWAGNPIIRTKTILMLFALWSVLLIIPVVVLVELVEDTGGWWAISWAVVSVFIFVPRISRSSRVVFALTTRRTFVSKRTMYCSIETSSLPYAEVRSARIKLNDDGTGEVYLRKLNDMYDGEALLLYNIKGIRDACRVLLAYLPPNVAEQGGLADTLSQFDDGGDDDDDGGDDHDAAGNGSTATL